MKITLVGVCVVYLLLLTGCRNDSDYLVGSYHVTTTVKFANCPANNFALPAQSILPTGFLPGQAQFWQWEIQRIAVTGAGADKITLTIRDPARPQNTLGLLGTLHNGVLRVEMSLALLATPCPIDRLMSLTGVLERDAIVGEIHTFLANAGNSAQCPAVRPPCCPCEVTEAFSGTR